MSERRPDAPSDSYFVISGDSHVGAPFPALRPYFDKRHRDGFEAFLASRPDPAASEAAMRGGFSAMAQGSTAILTRLGMDASAARSYAERSSQQLLALFDSDARDARLDEEGIAGEVVFPDALIENAPPFSDMQGAVGQRDDVTQYDWELRLAGARAFNRWLADFCSQSPDRRAGVAYMPAAYDVPAIVEEIRWAAQAGLRGGFLVPAVEGDLPPLHDPYYEPIWRVAEELEMPATLHGGLAEAPDHAKMYQGADSTAFVLAVAECRFWDARPFYYFLWGGIFERHPGLRLVFAEQTANWIPNTLAWMETMYDSFYMTEVRKTLSLRPIEYWKRQCAVTATFMSRAESEARHAIGLDQLMWGSDYPHPEGTWPYTDVCLRKTFSGLPTAEVQQMLGDNAVRLYGFDREKLAPLAARIGPRVEDVAKPPESLPSDYIGSGLD